MTEYCLKANGRITYVVGESKEEAITKLADFEKCETADVEVQAERYVEITRRL